jgi:hypothetical protein
MTSKPHTTHTTHKPITHESKHEAPPAQHAVPKAPVVTPLASTVKIDNHTMKSSAAITAAVNSFYGSTVLNKFSELDPALAEKQINTAAGATNFRHSGPLDRGINDPHWSPDALSHAMGLT